MKCRTRSISIGALHGELPSLFDVCECLKLVPCGSPDCTEGAHVPVLRCKACVL